jgi:hypothetical protein
MRSSERMASGAIGELDGFADDLMAERAVRPLVIVGASRVDHLLGEILRKYLLPQVAKTAEPDELLDRDTGPLATFSSRIKTSRRLGLIDESLYHALDRLRHVRNKSAHSVAFNHAQSPVRELLNEFRRHVVARHSYRLTKERYFDGATSGDVEELQCQLLTICVLLEAIRAKVKATKGSKAAIAIASK